MAHILIDNCSDCGIHTRLDSLNRCLLCSLKSEYRAEYRAIYLDWQEREETYPHGFWWHSYWRL